MTITYHSVIVQCTLTGARSNRNAKTLEITASLAWCSLMRLTIVLNIKIIVRLLVSLCVSLYVLFVYTLGYHCTSWDASPTYADVCLHLRQDSLFRWNCCVHWQFAHWSFESHSLPPFYTCANKSSCFLVACQFSCCRHNGTATHNCALFIVRFLLSYHCVCICTTIAYSVSLSHSSHCIFIWLKLI